MNVDLDKVLKFTRTRAEGRRKLAQEALTNDRLPSQAIREQTARYHEHSADVLTDLAADLEFLVKAGALA